MSRCKTIHFISNIVVRSCWGGGAREGTSQEANQDTLTAPCIVRRTSCGLDRRPTRETRYIIVVLAPGAGLVRTQERE